MLDFENFEFLTEAKSQRISGTKKKRKCVVFTDVCKSSELWTDGGASMFKAILKHEEQIFRIAGKYNGTIVKSIGDAYMLSFDSLEDGINFTIELQSEKPIKVGDSGKIELRIGICYGDVYEHETARQGKTLLDYFGNTVNTASRLESKVSEVGGFAFGFQSKISKSEKQSILKLMDEKCKSYKEYDYSDNKEVSEKRKRSGRLLNDAQNYIHRSINNLNGVDEIFVYKVDKVSNPKK